MAKSFSVPSKSPSKNPPKGTKRQTIIDTSKRVKSKALDPRAGWLKISQSKVKTFRRCHRAYHNKYVENLKRKRVKRPFMFGKIVHGMLEAFANGDDPFEVLDAIDIQHANLFAGEKEMYGEIIEDIRYIMTDYFDFWPEKDFVYVRVNSKGSEHGFEIELMDGVLWKGKIDGIGKTPNKLRWLGEHKTFTKMPGEDERWRNLQSVTYIRAIDILGWTPVDGTMWDYIRSKPPARPEMLKNGTLSKRQLLTIPAAYKAAIIANGEKVRDYADHLKTIEAKLRTEWFFRIHTPVGKKVLDRVFADFEATARLMLYNHERPDSQKFRDMNIDRHCGWCDYEPLCRAELQGLDVDFILEREYYVDDQDYSEIGAGYDEPDAE